MQTVQEIDLRKFSMSILKKIVPLIIIFKFMSIQASTHQIEFNLENKWKSDVSIIMERIEIVDEAGATIIKIDQSPFILSTALINNSENITHNLSFDIELEKQSCYLILEYRALYQDRVGGVFYCNDKNISYVTNNFSRITDVQLPQVLHRIIQKFSLPNPKKYVKKTKTPHFAIGLDVRISILFKSNREIRISTNTKF
jgi:hypothetical protein